MPQDHADPLHNIEIKHQMDFRTSFNQTTGTMVMVCGKEEPVMWDAYRGIQVETFSSRDKRDMENHDVPGLQRSHVFRD
jgi:hypothetical protein